MRIARICCNNKREKLLMLHFILFGSFGFWLIDAITRISTTCAGFVPVRSFFRPPPRLNLSHTYSSTVASYSGYVRSYSTLRCVSTRHEIRSCDNTYLWFRCRKIGKCSYWKFLWILYSGWALGEIKEEDYSILLVMATISYVSMFEPLENLPELILSKGMALFQEAIVCI